MTNETLIRFILAFLLVLQPLGHGVTHAGAPDSQAQIVICTSDGTKLVSIAIDKEIPTPGGQGHSCPCGILCSSCSATAAFAPLDGVSTPYNFARQELPGLEIVAGTNLKDWKASPRAPPNLPV